MITVVKPLLNMHRMGRISARILLEGQTDHDDIEWAEVVVFCRNNEPRHASILAAAQSRGLPLIYDLDDNLLELPPDCQGASPSRDAARRAMLEVYLRSAALVRVYSRSLAQNVAALNARVVAMFAPVDLSLIAPPRETRSPGPIKIVYATSRTQDPLCEIFLPALTRILHRHAGRVEAHFWGYRPPRFADLPHARHHGLICRYDHYLRRFSRGGFDIGLAPLPEDPFFRSKSNNKFREYGACGIAGIYSRNEVYSDCIENEGSGLLVPNDSQSWYDAIERLIEDESLRTRIQLGARQFVRERYAQERFELLFLSQILAVLDMPARSWCACVAEASHPSNAAPASAPLCAEPGYVRRLGEDVRQSLRALRRLGPRQAWVALRWRISDRIQAALLRWQLCRLNK